MARKVNQSTDSDELVDLEKPPQDGGSLGVPLEHSLTEVGGNPHVSASAAPASQTPAIVCAEFEAYGCGPIGRSIMLNGYKATVKDGKIFREHFDDIALIQAQGVSLREIKSA